MRASNLEITELQEFGAVEDVERIFGLRRTYTFNLIKDKKIRSVLLKRKGKERGKRLICLNSVRDFLNQEMEAQEDEAFLNDSI